MTKEEKEQTGKYVLQMANLLEDGCYQQEMLLKAVHIINESLEQESILTLANEVKDLSKRVEALENQMREDKEEQLKKLKAEIDYAKFRCALPAIPNKCKDCKWWKDSDGEYRRGCGAESICRINTDKVYQGEGYCYMFEPQESEVNKL